ncbi:MAG: ATP-dependent helicase RecG [Alphaproteobacteria bacterium]|jgi:ATP-dependent DNA helicase RecG|nr:ATP-dependent helicase RecG [Alphaproteobacteria bacterium]
MAQQLSLLEILERPTVEGLAKPEFIFTTDDWRFVVEQKENTRFDRKSAMIAPVGLAECLSAFGNGPAVEGGVIAIGIEKDGAVTGCSGVGEDKIQHLELMGRDHCPDGRFQTNRLEVINALGKPDFIIRARVFFVEDRLVELTNGVAFCRESDRSRRLTETEKAEIRINKGERAFELEVCPLNYPDDFRIGLVQKFAAQIRSVRDGSDDIPDEQILESMRLGRVKDGKFVPNNVCALVFAKDARRVFAGAYVHFLRYNGTEEKTGKDYNVIKDRIIDGTILEVIRDTASTLDANLREFTQFDSGKFYQAPEYPHDAWYEVLVNACVHRSYHAKTRPIFVKMFDDHLVVENPGGFMPSVTPENLFHKPRNPFLMFVLREFGEVRCISEGTKRIKRELLEAKLPNIQYVTDQNGVRSTLFNDVANRTNALDSEAYKALGEAMAFSLDSDERRIVNYVIEHGRINASDALRILSTTYWHTANGKLKRLVQRNVLDFVSKKHRDPKSHYVLHKGK